MAPNVPTAQPIATQLLVSDVGRALSDVLRLCVSLRHYGRILQLVELLFQSIQLTSSQSDSKNAPTDMDVSVDAYDVVVPTHNVSASSGVSFPTLICEQLWIDVVLPTLRSYVNPGSLGSSSNNGNVLQKLESTEVLQNMIEALEVAYLAMKQPSVNRLD